LCPLIYSCPPSTSFFPTTIQIWNQLPADVIMYPSMDTFKSRLTGTSATQMSIYRDTFVLFLSHAPASFYLSVELVFIVCFLHFMHICHARHYSTLRNVHYRKRRRRSPHPFYEWPCQMLLVQNCCVRGSSCIQTQNIVRTSLEQLQAALTVCSLSALCLVVLFK